MVFFTFSRGYGFAPDVVCLPTEEPYKHFSSASLLTDHSLLFHLLKMLSFHFKV